MRRERRRTVAVHDETASLASIRNPGAVQVVRIEGGGHFRHTIAAMGILPGIALRVVRGNAHGPVVVSVFRETVMIGQGMARRIIVRPKE